MAVPKPAHTPIQAPRGRRVHVIVGDDEKTACGRGARGGWAVVAQLVDCPGCLRRAAARAAAWTREPGAVS